MYKNPVVRPRSDICTLLAEKSRTVNLKPFVNNATKEGHHVFGVWCFEQLYQEYCRVQNYKYLREVKRSCKCVLKPVVYCIRSVQTTPTSITFTEQSKADILCALKC
jgi:hypothetical protein